MTPVRAEAIRTLYLQMRNSAGAALVVTVYMVGTAAAYTPWRTIAIWAGIQGATQLWRELLIRAWRRQTRDDAALGPWADRYTVYMVVTGCLWGSTIYLFAHPGQPITLALTLCCLYAVSAGSVPGNAYNPHGLYALVGFMFAPIVVRLIALGSLQYTLLGVASGLYAVTMMAFCRVQARTIDDGFRIRFENRALLDALQIQKADAEDARHRAELANLAKSQFLAAASHDLRQPLYALSLFSASLAELRLGEDGRVIVSNIQDSIGAMESLFEGLLDLSRLEAGVIRPRLEATSVDALFDRLSQYFYPIALDRGLDLRFRSNGEWVTSDATLLEQVLSNLVSNALRCTTEGGVLVAARSRAETINLEVWDTGIGIDAPDLDRIFHEFVQLGNAERDRRKGLGLGLSIARRSGTLIGASVAVASRLGVGSRFAIAQPVASSAAGASKVANWELKTGDPLLAWHRHLPVLIVDDDRDVLSALSGLLRRWEVRFEAVANGDAALALIEGGAHYGLVLADYRLTGALNGLDLIQSLVCQSGQSAPACALITADFDPAMIARARAMGIPVIQKPLRLALLREILGIRTRT